MARRFFVDDPIEGATATLAESEAHHLIHVMRAKPGAEVVLFDGSGAEYRAAIIEVNRATVDLHIVEKTMVDRELSRRIHLIVSLPKGDRQKWLIEKCVELGVQRVTPLTTDRSVAQPTGKARSRLCRAVIEASKQCGRNRLMEIGEPQSLANFLLPTTPSSISESDSRWIAHPSGDPVFKAIADVDTQAIAAIVGPEGGFTDDEIRAATMAGWKQMSLGSRILRIETAALLIAAACQ